MWSSPTSLHAQAPKVQACTIIWSMMPRHQFLVLEVDVSLLWWVKTMPESTLDIQSSPKPGGCKGNSTFISRCGCIASVWVGFELKISERRIIGKVAVSSWRYWVFLCVFLLSGQQIWVLFGEILSSVESETKPDLPFSLIKEAWQPWSNALALEQILKTN